MQNTTDLKIKELHLAYEYQVEKQKEKEALKQLRAEERERAKLEKEIAEARKKIEQNAIESAIFNIDNSYEVAAGEESTEPVEEDEYADIINLMDRMITECIALLKRKNYGYYSDMFETLCT